MSINERISYRNSLPRVSIWEFSSSDDEVPPQKKQKIEEKKVEKEEISDEVNEKEYGPTMKNEVKSVNVKLLEHLGYVNRNNRPPSSKKNEILPTLDTKRQDLAPSIAEKREKEKQKIIQIKLMLESKKNISM